MSSSTVSGCGSSSIPALSISTKGVKCTGAGEPSTNPACTGKGEYGYGSWANYADEGTASIAKSLKKLSATIDGTAFSFKISNASLATCSPTSGPLAGSTEVGFTINGTVKSPKTYKGSTVTLTACLGTDTGPGTTGTFDGDFNQPDRTVATASIDGSAGASTLDIS